MDENTALTVVQPLAVMPIMSIRDAVDRHKQMVGFVQEIMHEGTDFGTIPGTNKPTLYKPGAEKLTTFFGLVPRFVVIEKTEEWGEGEHEPLFYYWFKCELYRHGQLVGEADGSCSSRESKYRYRKSARKCPKCGVEAIIKGRDEYGGGWVCWRKNDGCGATFKDGDQNIEGQKTGRVLNEDIADLANTILKMAQKRALVAATLIAVNASEFFTQDMEDVNYGDVIDGQIIEKTPAAKSPTKPKHWIESENVRKRFWAYANVLTLSDADVHAALEVEHVSEYTGTMPDAKVALDAYISDRIAETDEAEAEGPPPNADDLKF